MGKFKYLRVSLILTAATLQGILISSLFSWHSTCVIAQETPEPGSIILMGLGAIALMRKKYRKS